MVVDLRFTAERIQALRKRLGLTQLEFATRVGIAQSTVSLWETGGRTPEGAEVLMKLTELEREAMENGA